MGGSASGARRASALARLAVLSLVLFQAAAPAAATTGPAATPGPWKEDGVASWSGVVDVSGEQTFPADALLRIAPGTEVRSAGPDARLVIRGELEARGTPVNPAVIGVPVVLHGAEAEAHLAHAALRTDEAPAVEVRPEASLDLRNSLVRTGSAGLVVQSDGVESRPNRSVTVEDTIFLGADEDEAPAGVGLRLEPAPDAVSTSGGEFQGMVEVLGNRFVNHRVGLAVDGWDAHGLRFQDNHFEGNTLAVQVGNANLNLHNPTFEDNAADATVADEDGTLRLDGDGLDDVDIQVADGASAQAGDHVVREHPRGAASRLAAALAAGLLLLYGFLKYILPRGLLARLLFRKEDKELLEHEARRRIYEALQEEPGLHLRELGRRLGGYRRAVYHTRVLEEADILTSEDDGGYVRYYVADAEDPDEARGIRSRLLQRVREEPGIEQAEVARELGCSRQLASYHARQLEDEDVVDREECRGRKRLYPGDH